MDAVVNYLQNILYSIGALLWSVATTLIRRIILLMHHILVKPFQIIGKSFRQDPDTTYGQRLLNILLKFFGWVGIICTKILDVLLIGSILDLVFQLVKPNQRRLTVLELTEAKKVFGDQWDYWKIRIDEHSLIAWLGARFAGTSNMGTTTFRTINFTRKLQVAPGNSDMEWLIHELAHVIQMEQVGIQYIFEALIAQFTEGYDYGIHSELLGKKLSDFNREQQAEIAAHYYDDSLYGSTPSAYFLPHIEEFKNSRRLWWS